MALIATVIERPGIARMFFDLRKADPAPDDERRIATAIEHAFAMAAAERQMEPVTHAT